MESGPLIATETQFPYSDEEIFNTNLLIDDDVSSHDNEKGTGEDRGLNEDEDCEVVPAVGMKFKDVEELYEFYAKYAYRVGFPVGKRNSRRGEDGLLRNVAIACSREGKKMCATSNALKPQPTMQTGCKAKLSALSDVNGIWRITKVHLEHNHLCSPTKSRSFRCNRKLSAHVKRQLEVNDIAGIPLHKTFNSAVVEAGGYEEVPYIERDCRNYIEKARRLRLGDGDAAAIQAYFCKMQAACPGFYFSLDLDNEGRLRNVFWADNRCREAYKEFGDVITFDTTYLTNKYDMPFAPFVGVNHHGHSTLLGCGLLSSENTDTFVWLFKTWLQCMDGQAPSGIVTDQDRAMQNAIGVVFPGTRHRWCLWHILKKLPEKFGYHNHKASIMSAIHELVYESQHDSEFEEGWTRMLDEYILHDNDWLDGLYRERRRWVPCYLRTSFWAGMSTTQRSESVNAFFDGYVKSKTSLKQFVEQYERALRSKAEKEFQADCKCFTQAVPCATRYELEKQFQSVYTIAKFKEFQQEFTGMVYCQVVGTSGHGDEKIYAVHEDHFFDGGSKMKKFVVSFKAVQCEIVCSCHLFEFKGILCRHTLLVFKLNGVTSVPGRYILRRWRKDVSRLYQRVKVNYTGWKSTPAQLRYDQVSRVFTKVANLAVDDEKQTSELISWLEEKFNDFTISKAGEASAGANIVQDTVEINVDTTMILDPKVTKSKGAPKKNRKKGPLESNPKKSRVRSTSNQSRTNQQASPNPVDTVSQAQYVLISPLSYTQQLMGAQTQPWYQPSGGSSLPPIGIGNSWSSVFQPQVRSFEQEFVGSSGGTVGSSGGTETTDRVQS